MLIAVNFHYVREAYDAPFPGIHGLLPADFEAQLDTLAACGDFVGAADILDALDGSPLPKKSIVITFDDGLREQFEVAWPILQRKGIPAIFYVNTINRAKNCLSTVHKIHLLRAYAEPGSLWRELCTEANGRDIPLASIAVDETAARTQYPYDAPEAARLKFLLNRVLDFDTTKQLISSLYARLRGDSLQEIDSLYMTVEHMRALNTAGCLGNHGHEHIPMGEIGAQAFKSQLCESSAHLQDWVGAGVVSFSFPYGSFSACSETLSSLASSFGIRFGFTMERAGNTDLSSPLYLARFACNDLPGGNHARYSAATLHETVAAASWFRA